ncbi:MAG TPA: hypothetical protein VHM91_22495, partial [Verrucomicrobiales bacterium]|nr:hypothetical protein [Verrucomicrobiales bacterium]
MNNEPEPRISRSLELLENLRRSAASFAAKEEELTKDISRRRYAAERSYQNGLKDDAAWLSRVSGEADTAWKKLSEQTKARFDARGQRVEKAERSARRELPKRVQMARGEWLGGLQRQKLRLEKEVAGELEAADQALAKTKAKLQAQGEHLEKITARGRSLLRGSLSLRGALK